MSPHLERWRCRRRATARACSASVRCHANSDKATTRREPMTEPQITTTSGTSMVLDEAAVQGFKTSLRGPLLRPGDAGYDDARQVWNGMIDRRPALIVRCTGVADVITAVQFARTHDLLVAIRGEGHNVAG